MRRQTILLILGLLWCYHAQTAENKQGKEEKLFNISVTLEISIPHGASALKMNKMDFALIEKRESDMAKETILGRPSSGDIKWNAKKHGYAGPMIFKNVTIPKNGQIIVRAKLTATWAGKPVKDPFYSSKIDVRRAIAKSGDSEEPVDIGKARIKFKKP